MLHEEDNFDGDILPNKMVKTDCSLPGVHLKSTSKNMPLPRQIAERCVGTNIDKEDKSCSNCPLVAEKATNYEFQHLNATQIHRIMKQQSLLKFLQSSFLLNYMSAHVDVSFQQLIESWKIFYIHLAYTGLEHINRQIDQVIWEIVNLNILIRDFSVSEREITTVAKLEKANCAQRLSELEVQLRYIFKIKVVLEEIAEYEHWSFCMDLLIDEMAQEVLKIRSSDFTRRRG